MKLCFSGKYTFEELKEMLSSKGGLYSYFGTRDVREVDRIILPGGIAYSKRIVNDIIKRVEFIAPVEIIPGEEELESLALGALRVIRGEESAALYS